MRKINKRISVILISLIFLITGCSSDESSQVNSEESKELRVAYDTAPPTIDPHISTAAVTMDFAAPIYEGLVTMNSNYEPELMLAESFDVSEDLKTITFNLRKGVMFHNGEEMMAEDVVASMNRWKGTSILAKANLSDSTFEVIDDYTVALKLDTPAPLIMSVLGNPMQFAGIMPKEVIENASAEGVNEYIGTGPFEVEEWKEEQYLHLKKFNDYSALSTPSDGLAGKKEVFVDDVILEIVTDSTTRVSGVQTGQYDIALRLPYDNFEQLEADSSLKTYAEDYGFIGLFFNKKEGVFSDIKMRKAVNAALNMDEIMIAAYGNEEFYSLEHSLAAPKQESWYNDAGKDQYNQKDPEKAKQLLKEAGYNGEEITFLVTRAYPEHYAAAVVIQEQLKEIGMNISLDEYDWATLLTHRADSSAWDIFASGFTFEPTPINAIFLHSENEYAGWTNSPEIDSLVEQIRQSESEEERKALFTELQGATWDYLPYIRYGNYKPLHAMQKTVSGFTEPSNIILWNIKKE